LQIGWGSLPRISVNGLIDPSSRPRPVEFPSRDIRRDDGGTRGGAVGGMLHWIVGVGAVEEAAYGGDVGRGCLAEDEGVGWGCESERGIEG
jgi:hypothetical protein